MQLANQLSVMFNNDSFFIPSHRVFIIFITYNER